MGLLTETHKQKLISHLSDKKGACQLCRGQNFGISDEVLGLPILERSIPAGLGPGQRVLPVAVVECLGCNNITFVPIAAFMSLEDL